MQASHPTPPSPHTDASSTLRASHNASLSEAAKAPAGERARAHVLASARGTLPWGRACGHAPDAGVCLLGRRAHLLAQGFQGSQWRAEGTDVAPLRRLVQHMEVPLND